MVSFTLILLIAAAAAFVAVGGVEKSQDLFFQAKDTADKFKGKINKGKRN